MYYCFNCGKEINPEKDDFILVFSNDEYKLLFCKNCEKEGKKATEYFYKQKYG